MTGLHICRLTEQLGMPRATGVKLGFHVTSIHRDFISAVISVIPLDNTHVA